MDNILKRIDGKYMVDSNGNFLSDNQLPYLEFTISGETFPAYLTTSVPSRYFSFESSDDNTIFIDFGDGSPVHSESFSGFINYQTPIHTYNTSGEYTVKLWFEHPQLVNYMRFSYINFVGLFPLNIGLYNLNDLYISSAKFTNFPIMSGGIFNSLRFNYITTTTINFLPNWITASRITSLQIGGGFDLSDLEVSNLEKLIDIQGLEICHISNTVDNANLPSNLAAIGTLRKLGFGGSPITEIGSIINSCKQIEYLSIGRDIGGFNTSNSSFNSWGLGVEDMPNLKELRVQICQNLPASIPTGVETAPLLKTIDMHGSYQTQLKIDDAVDSFYAKVITEASMVTGNTLLRQVTWNVGWVSNSFKNNRPSGTYQEPSGYVQGVSNGTPVSQMEKIWVLVNQYKWIVTVTNESGTGNQIFAP